MMTPQPTRSGEQSLYNAHDVWHKCVDFEHWSRDTKNCASWFLLALESFVLGEAIAQHGHCACGNVRILLLISLCTCLESWTLHFSVPPHLTALFKIPKVLFSLLLFHAYDDLVVEKKRLYRRFVLISISETLERSRQSLSSCSNSSAVVHTASGSLCMCACNSQVLLSIMYLMCSLQTSWPRKLLVKKKVNALIISGGKWWGDRKFYHLHAVSHLVKRVFTFQKAFSVGLVLRYVFGGLERTLRMLKYFQLSGIQLTYKKKAARKPPIALQAQLLCTLDAVGMTEAAGHPHSLDCLLDGWDVKLPN